MTILGSDEIEPTADDRLHDALIGFTGCIGEALDDVCSYSLTIGDSYVPFSPDPEDQCEEGEEACSQAWVRVTGITPKADSSWEGSCALVLEIGLEVGVLRCMEIPEEGHAPEATEVMASALQSMADMRKILCAAMNCEVWNSIEAGTWQPHGPLGGQFGGSWDFTVEF